MVAVILADGFEEIEAVTIIDVLRRGGVEVSVTGIAGTRSVTGAHGVSVSVDNDLADVDHSNISAVILPGGMPGSENLAASEAVLTLLRDTHDGGGLVGAICAAPIALHAAGLLDDQRTTSYPTFAERLPTAIYVEEPVVVDGRIVTSRGPGTALVFALQLLRELGRPKEAAALRTGMLVTAL